jgi:hypothetical protein
VFGENNPASLACRKEATSEKDISGYEFWFAVYPFFWGIYWRMFSKLVGRRKNNRYTALNQTPRAIFLICRQKINARTCN